jgi:hypothetical protein
MASILTAKLSRGRLLGVLAAAPAVAASALTPRRAGAQDGVTIQTRVQFLHAATDLGQIEVHLNDDEVLDEFTYGMVSDWIDVAPGTVWLTLYLDRAGINYINFQAVYPVQAGNDYVVVITDALVIPSVVDRSPIEGDVARVRFTHATVETPAVNVTAGDVGLASELTYARLSEPVELAPGSHEVTVSLADTGDTVLTAPIEVEAGRTYDVVLMGDPTSSDAPLTLTTLVDDPTEGAATPTA